MTKSHEYANRLVARLDWSGPRGTLALFGLTIKLVNAYNMGYNSRRWTEDTDLSERERAGELAADRELKQWVK